MAIPEDLHAALNHELATMPRNTLANAAQQLSERYRSSERDKPQVFMSDTAHRLAYLAVRMPATYAVVNRVLEEIKRRIPEFSPKILCDLGAGPGTASWAAAGQYPDIEKAFLYEKDANWLEIGRRLMKEAEVDFLRSALWQSRELSEGMELEPADLVILSYVIGELPIEGLPKVISRVWQKSSHLLVIIEPGTPHGFERIRKVREHLINEGAYLVAPCPHMKACPMTGGDWCHFAQRLERTAMHMAIKDVELGYEDEKYSYVVASKTPVELPEARILRHPQHHSGHIELTLCAREGLEKKTISRRHGELYKKARKLEWGDAL